MKNLRYDVIGAGIDYGVKLHPQNDMRRLGYNIIKSRPMPICDCWWFRVENDIENRPGYLHDLGDDFLFPDEEDLSESKQICIKTPPRYKQDGSLTDWGKDHCENLAELYYVRWGYTDELGNFYGYSHRDWFDSEEQCKKFIDKKIEGNGSYFKYTQPRKANYEEYKEYLRLLKQVEELEQEFE